MPYRDAFGEINGRLADLRAQLLDAERLERLRAATHREHIGLQLKAAVLEQELAREQADVTALEGVRPSALLARLLGTRGERLEEERSELVAARLKHDEVLAELEAGAVHLASLDERIAALAHVRARYESLLEEKATQVQGPAGEQLAAMAESLGQLAARLKEADDAIEAGCQAFAELQTIRGALAGADTRSDPSRHEGNRSVHIARHGLLEDARRHVPVAQAALSRFEREAREIDVQVATSGLVDLDPAGGFAMFADRLIDSLVHDWTLQSRILRSLGHVDLVVVGVEDAIQKLRALRGQLTARIDDLHARSRELVEKLA